MTFSKPAWSSGRGTSSGVCTSLKSTMLVPGETGEAG
jgi:hypothetical protein